MQNVYIKRGYLDEDENKYILYYLHFQGEYAVRQLEIHEDKIVMVSKEHPIVGDDRICDQKFSYMECSSEYFITENEFNDVWNKYARQR